MLARILFSGVIMVAFASSVFAARPFTVVVYNVENVHDADGVAVYDDYQPDRYGAGHMITKLSNVATLLKRFRGGQGPDIVLLQEMEIDQTTDSTVSDLEAFLAAWRDVPLAGMAEQIGADPQLAGVPVEVWLMKALADHGLMDYTVVVGSDAAALEEHGSGPAIKNVTLTKFPVVAIRQYPVESARNILETELEIEGQPLFVFNNHWKSGASNPEMESFRIQNAQVLRDRLDEIFEKNPQADVLIGGDLNSQYNQKLRYPVMPRTGIDDILRVGYSEPALRAAHEELYNLWFELETAQRGSDVYRGEWGTLMHLIVSRGLYDGEGIQYQDNSFAVARFPGQNADAAGAPIRWSAAGGTGSGFSDHLPIYAHFRTVDPDQTVQWMPLDDPSDTPPTAEVLAVNYAAVDLTQALILDALPRDTDLRDGSWTGKLFKVSGPALGEHHSQVRFAGEVYAIYAPQQETRDRLKVQAGRNRSLNFYGELGTYKGDWQFVIRDVTWVP